MTRRTTRHMIGALVALALALVLGLVTGDGLLGGRDAHAVIGRPLTPMSYAGVARRTTRRAVYTGAAYGPAYHGGYYAPPVVATTAVVTALPAGCVQSGAYYACGTVRYAPAYNGTTLVYQQL
jgi:hypothetical protein